MIDLVLIEQFQNHIKTELEFSPGLNIVCGQSDNGKSAIVRAIAWVLTNKPSGDAFRKIDHEGMDTKVKLTFTDGEVLRVRGHKKNLYRYGGDDYKAMRSDVPEDIADFINIGEQNIQSQFASHYLVSESSGEVARVLNSIVGLEDIDKANKKVSRIIADANSNIKFLTGELEKHQEKMNKYEELDILDDQLKNLERIQSGINVLEKEEQGLTDVIHQLVCTTEEISPLEKLIEFEEKIENLLVISKDIGVLENELSIMQAYVREIVVGNEVLESGAPIISEEDKINALLQGYENLSNPDDLEDLVDDILLTKTELDTAIGSLDAMVKGYAEAMEKQRTCPLCERKIK